uniref:Inner membrane protein n=1 Tax=Elaeophora elaphi TaxID=1147741 RepID=A0A0R3S4J4_9BILA
MVLLFAVWHTFTTATCRLSSVPVNNWYSGSPDQQDRSEAAMARPTNRRNRFFWELIVAFMLVVSAVVFQTFHFFNNAWLVQINDSYIYQRGLGDDCVKNDEFSDGIRCTGWLNSRYSTFVINGQNITASDVVPPSI